MSKARALQTFREARNQPAASGVVLGYNGVAGPYLLIRFVLLC